MLHRQWIIQFFGLAMTVDKIRFVVASRHSASDFHEKSLLGSCLQLYQDLYELDLYDRNSDGLPHVYNQSIEKSFSDPAILVFIHDDVYLMDFWWSVRIREALNKFDIVGVAGNMRRQPNQATWAHAGEDLTMFDWDYISGCVGGGNGLSLPEKLYVSGPSWRECKLLDGVFLACKSDIFFRHDFRFDERFNFHFYDMDFCRQAELLGLKMGTWGIPIIHESTGNADNLWFQSRNVYFDKWKS